MSFIDSHVVALLVIVEQVVYKRSTDANNHEKVPGLRISGQMHAPLSLTVLLAYMLRRFIQRSFGKESQRSDSEMSLFCVSESD